MADHPTVTDKNRKVTLIANNQFNGFMVLDRDGKLRKGLKPDVPGIYLIQYQLAGNAEATYDATFRVERYPYDAEDAGTAWDDVRLRRGRWHVTRGGSRVTIHPDGKYSTSIGISYRIPVGAKVTVDQRIVKFTKVG